MPPKRILIASFCLALLCSCGAERQTAIDTNPIPDQPAADTIAHSGVVAAQSLYGKDLYAPIPSEKNLAKLDTALADYESDPTNAENIIWYGRRLGYLSRYSEAIAVFSKGIELHPNDARMYRHRGHRYISIRQFDNAVRDLEKASDLIMGTENEIEPDGMPNARNIPVSTLHGNIWYHLGLAQYLQGDLHNALQSYMKCRSTGENGDNIVSSSHWLYMILNLLDRKDEAEQVLKSVRPDIEVIENFSYHKLCRFYQGELKEADLLGGEDSASANDAILYGIANWYFYNGRIPEAKEKFKEILARSSWSSFGFIAAEADYLRHFGDLKD